MVKSFMENYGYIKVKLLTMIVFLMTVFSIIAIYYEKIHTESEMNKKHNILRQNIKTTFNVLLKDLQDHVSTKMNTVLTSDNNIVKEKFALKDRDGLYKALRTSYDDMKSLNKYLKIMTFRSPDGSTFLRVHKPEMYGDKLNQKRKIIIDTNRLKKSHFGFEVGKLKMTYRVVIPIFYEKKHIGLVEVGIEPEYIIDKLDRIYNLKNALLIKKEMKSVILSKAKYDMVGKEFYYVRGDEVFKKHLKEIDFNTKHNHILENGREYHIDSTLNLKDHKNSTMAKVLLAYDTTDNVKEFSYVLKMNIFKDILLVLVVLIVLNISFNYFINKIIVETRKNIRNEKQLSEQSKMVSMGEMIGNIAHQWRQPLSVISTGATGLKVQKEFNTLTDEFFIEACDMINDNAQYLSKTIDDFKNFIKGDRELETFYIKDNIDSFINLLKSSIKNHNISVILDLEEDIKIHSYPNELIQCFINIFNNSKDVLIKLDGKDRFVFISTFNQNNKTIIKIKDSGGGIPEEILPKIFEPYFTTKHQSQGTGLGLHMTYNLIVDGMGGAIEVQNSNYDYKGKSYSGAEFIIILPMS